MDDWDLRRGLGIKQGWAQEQVMCEFLPCPSDASFAQAAHFFSIKGVVVGFILILDPAILVFHALR
jgi:hypothetical protein